MHRKKITLTIFIIFIALFALASVVIRRREKTRQKGKGPGRAARPASLLPRRGHGRRVSSKLNLSKCSDGPFKKTDFSIGHRGAALQFPEHTQESYVAAARMGAGIIECDVTFTKDRELVCRHSQCDLHTTTDVVAREDLRREVHAHPPNSPRPASCLTPADIRCCTSDFTLAEFKSLCGKMDAANRNATTIEEYMDATASWRTDLYSTCGTVLSHAESIELFKDLGVKMTPELKSPSVEMPYEGDYTQEDYAQQMIDEYKAARVNPKNVFAQSFNLDDVLYWINNEPQVRQAGRIPRRSLQRFLNSIIPTPTPGRLPWRNSFPRV